jgi:zinc-ribbon domain
MYCPTCGAQLAEVLSFCKHCGASLPTAKGGDQIDPAETAIDTLTWVIVGTTITILGMGLGALVLMKQGQIDAGLGSIFVIACFAALWVVDAVLVWRLLRLNKANKERRTLAQAEAPKAEEPSPAQTRALRDPGEPVPSVTEQTTHTFEPSYRDRERR